MNYQKTKNIKLYFDDKIENINDIVIIFGHLDGLYSYCWLEEDKSKIIHINATTKFVEYKDGYKYTGDEDEVKN